MGDNCSFHRLVQYTTYFMPETKKYLNEQDIEFKVLPLVDNAPGHPQFEDENVQVLFMSSEPILIQHWTKKLLPH